MNGYTARTMAGFKDSAGRYLFSFGWQDSGMAAEVPKTIGGYPYVYSQFMPNASSSACPVFFGDQKCYYIINRLGVTIQVLRETRAKLNQVELVARVRFGGQLVEPWRGVLLRCA